MTHEALDLDMYWHELKRLGTAHGESIWDKESWCEPFYEGKTAADAFYEELKTLFKIDVQKGVDLFTVRHFDDNAIKSIEAKGTSLLTQVNKETIQIVLITK